MSSGLAFWIPSERGTDSPPDAETWDIPGPDSKKYSLEPSVTMGGGTSELKELVFLRPSLVSWAKPVILGGASGRVNQKAIAKTTTTKIPTSAIGQRFFAFSLPDSFAIGSAEFDTAVCDVLLSTAAV